MSIQVAILKVLASHGDGRATLASLKRDIIILSTSGPDWDARIKRLARRVPSIDIFGDGLVLRDDEGWQITSAGREFLSALEAVSQDNLPAEWTCRRRRSAAKARSSSSVTGSDRLRKDKETAGSQRVRRQLDTTRPERLTFMMCDDVSNETSSSRAAPASAPRKISERYS